MANFSAAFGYDFYIVPLLSSNVVTSSVASGASAFIDDASPIEGAVSATTTYTGGTTPVLTVNGAGYELDGTADVIRLAGLTQASLETDTSSEDIFTYDDESKGFNTAIATSKSFTISLSGVADFQDVGYQVLRLTEQNTVADSLRVKFLRVGPTGTVESVYGYGTLTGYSESNEVSSIVSWECTLTGYGTYGLDLQPVG